MTPGSIEARVRDRKRSIVELHDDALLWAIASGRRCPKFWPPYDADEAATELVRRDAMAGMSGPLREAFRALLSAAITVEEFGVLLRCRPDLLAALDAARAVHASALADATVHRIARENPALFVAAGGELRP